MAWQFLSADQSSRLTGSQRGATPCCRWLSGLIIGRLRALFPAAAVRHTQISCISAGRLFTVRESREVMLWGFTARAIVPWHTVKSVCLISSCGVFNYNKVSKNQVKLFNCTWKHMAKEGNWNNETLTNNLLLSELKTFSMCHTRCLWLGCS